MLRGITGAIQTVMIMAAVLSHSVSPASANADPSEICDRAAIFAASQTGVPISVLKAISLTETGRDQGGVMRPWPWTVNMEGKGVWFETEDAAQAYAEEHFKRGARSFDVGCFQINYKWHHEHFTSLQAMFDPGENALYAAQFLGELYAELGDWAAAAGAYHSRTPEYAERYAARFSAFRAEFQYEDHQPLRVVAIDSDAPAPSSVVPHRERVNTFPLLQSGGASTLGSLVPLSAKPAGASLFPGGAG